MKTCKIDGCNDVIRAYEMCNSHYAKARRAGQIVKPNNDDLWNFVKKELAL